MASLIGSVLLSHITLFFRRSDAMKEFIAKHERNIVGILSGWDRVRFRGTIRMLAVVKGLVLWLSSRRVLFKDFKPFALGLTAQLKASVEQVAAATGKTIRYVASSTLSKEDLVEELLRREKIAEGVVCVLSCVEPCQSFDIQRNPESKHLDLVSRVRKCLHWYVYFLDSTFGLCHVRIQSWLPFTVHVCINGREWLCRELTTTGIRFTRRDNCLVRVADVAMAQEMLQRQPWENWSEQLNGLLRRACPALLDLMALAPSPPAVKSEATTSSDWPPRDHAKLNTALSYYWSADETEWATDLMFRSPQKLAELYPALLRHAITTFSSRDVMRYLGRTRLPARGGVPVRFNGDVVSTLRERPEGVRIKHALNANSLKMYDKQGSVLRVETTINDAHDLAAYRASESDPHGPKKWRRLRKGVADLPRRAELSQAANARYLSALAAVENPTPLGRVADKLIQPVTWSGRRARGLTPLTGPDARLAEIALHGEFLLNGFRNRDIRSRLFPVSQETPPAPAELRRQAGQVTRLLRLFQAHGLFRKIPKTHRYQLTANGRRTLPAFLAARNASAQKLQQLAA
jgi:hypothetical protein